MDPATFKLVRIVSCKFQSCCFYMNLSFFSPKNETRKCVVGVNITQLPLCVHGCEMFSPYTKYKQPVKL